MAADNVSLEVLAEREDIRQVNHTIHMKFRDLSVKANGKFILQNIHGEIKPGEIMAIMGPSG